MTFNWTVVIKTMNTFLHVMNRLIAYNTILNLFWQNRYSSLLSRRP